MTQKTEIDELVLQLINLPAGTKEYFKCLEKIRWLEIGGQTLGKTIDLEPVPPTKGIIDINISKAF